MDSVSLFLIAVHLVNLTHSFFNFLACHGLIGAGFVFYRDPVSGHWTLNQSYPSPAGPEGHFGYAVDIAKNYSVIGAWGFGKWLRCA